MSTHDLIAGALFDFMGRLTSQAEPLTLSSKHEPHDLLNVFEEWAAERRLDTTSADVERWQFRIPDQIPATLTENQELQRCTKKVGGGKCLYNAMPGTERCRRHPNS